MTWGSPLGRAFQSPGEGIEQTRVHLPHSLCFQRLAAVQQALREQKVSFLLRGGERVLVGVRATGTGEHWEGAHPTLRHQHCLHCCENHLAPTGLPLYTEK